jgi:hypothetical protein
MLMNDALQAVMLLPESEMLPDLRTTTLYQVLAIRCLVFGSIRPIRTVPPIGRSGDGTKVQPPPPPIAAPRPRRFYAKIALDPNRPTPQVSNIAQSILSELDRVRGTRMTLTLDIDAETADGFPEDVESVVRDNATSLRITDFGFEGE